MLGKILFVLCLLPFSIFAQEVVMSHNYNASLVVFGDHVNLRSEPSLHSKIVDQVSAPEVLINTYRNAVLDTINGQKAYWIEVLYKNKKAFIWQGLLAHSVLKSQNWPNQKFLIQDRGNTSMKIKVFKKNAFYKSFNIASPDSFLFSCATFLGTTYNSDSNDVLFLCFRNKKNQKIQSYSWNGSQLIPFNKPLLDSSFLFYSSTKHSWIAGQAVGIRKFPKIESKTLARLSYGDKVRLLNPKYERDTIQSNPGYWAQILYKGDTAYCWSSYLALAAIHSYKEKDLIFLIRRKLKSYKNQIFAIKQGQILDTMEFNSYSNFRGMHPMGTMGLKMSGELIGVCFESFSCGQASGDVHIAWSGKHFYPFPSSIGVGDGGLSDGKNVIFPVHRSGKENQIITQDYDSESIDIYGEKGEENYDNIYRLDLVRIFKLLGDSLLEVENETTRIEAFLSREFPKFRLNFYKSADLNNDAYQDVVLYAVDTMNQHTEAYYKRSHKSMIAILFGNKDGSYSLHAFSKKLIQHEENSPLCKIEISNQGFDLYIYYSGYYNENMDARQYKMEYEYDAQLKAILLRKTTVYIPGSEYSSAWEKKEYHYRKNAILFQDSYQPED